MQIITYERVELLAILLIAIGVLLYPSKARIGQVFVAFAIGIVLLLLFGAVR